MKLRVPVVVSLACACALTIAAAALAQGQPASTDSTAAGKPATAESSPATMPAAPESAQATKKPAATKLLGKSTAAAPAVDAAVRSIDAQITKLAVDKKVAGWRTRLKLPAMAKFDPAKSYYARMGTNKGEMLIKFKPDAAPMHVTSFIYLARLGYFDGLKFHRVIKGFMAQGGDPLGNGTGGPGYQFNGEFSPTAKHNAAGILSTANAGPGTDGSQFFLMFKADSRLDGSYSVFGQVEEGLETLKAMEAVGNPGDGAPTQPLWITKVTIEVR